MILHKEMDPKIKILLGILVAVILATGGWWIWSGQKEITCTQDAALNFLYTGQGDDPCDRSCESDNDCKLECGCECISKDEKCIYTGIVCEAPDPNYGCKCINNTCEYKYIELKKQEIPEQRALELANQLLHSKCDTMFPEIKKVHITRTFFYNSPKEDICPGIKGYMLNHSEIWMAEKTLVEEAPVCTPDMPGTCTEGKLISAVVLIGLKGEFICGYALDHHAAPGILSLEEVCAEKPTQQVTITTDKTEYELGGTVNVTISNVDKQIYVSYAFGTGMSFYQLKENLWEKLTTNCETNCIMICDNDTLKPGPCIQEAPPLYLYYEYIGPWEAQWNQKECIYETKLCGSENYSEGSLRQVSAGKFKVEFCYFDKEDIDLSKPPGYASPDKKKCIEKEFTIKEKVGWIIASEDELLGKYEKSDKRFRRYEIGDSIVYWHQRMIDDAIVEFDYIRYKFDKNTKELIEKDIHWRDDLPEHLPPIIPKEQAESMIGGKVKYTNLWFISPESDVFPIKPTPKNPCWVVSIADNNGYITDVIIIDAVESKILGYGIPPP